MRFVGSAISVDDGTRGLTATGVGDSAASTNGCGASGRYWLVESVGGGGHIPFSLVPEPSGFCIC